MTGCMENPAIPCAMTGACAVLSGFDGLAVVIHGASGCYYYPKSLLKAPLYSTLLLESEIVMGTVDRLHDVISQLETADKPVAVVNTCVPALTGDDLSKAFASTSAIFVDSPGYLGNAEAGVKAAYDALDIHVNPERPGVNIDGVLGLDLFSRGNLHEAQRLLALMGIPCSLRLAADQYTALAAGAAPYTVSVNPSWNASIGDLLGSLLFPDLEETGKNLETAFPDADVALLYDELQKANDTLYYYADKYLRKYTPPTVAIASQKSYCTFAEQMLTRYLGSDITVSLPREDMADSAAINQTLQDAEPDLLLGSSFEAAAVLNRKTAFVGITQPDRSRITMSAQPMTGIEGGIRFMERCLNALMDVKKRIRIF